MCCSLDATWRMKIAAQRLAVRKIPSIYLEMPGCTHGNIADGERIFNTAFEWLEAPSG
jgi:hypothetical protein